MLVFNRDGDFLRGWGGPADPGFLTNRCAPAMGCEWPTNEHGIFVDHNDFVYIAGNGGPDNQVLKFTMDGTFVLQIGKSGIRSKVPHDVSVADINTIALARFHSSFRKRSLPLIGAAHTR